MKKGLIVIALCFATLGSFSFAKAEIITSNTLDNSVVSTSVGPTYQTLPLGTTGVPSYMQFYASTTNALPENLGSLNIISCSTTSLSSCYVYATLASAVNVSATKGLVTAFITATTTMNPSRYHYINFPSITYSRFYGSTSSNYTGGVTCTNLAAADTCSFQANVKGLWFVLGGTELEQLQAAVYEIDNITEYETLSSTNVPVSFSYLNTDMAEVGVEMIDVTNNQLVLRTNVQTANQNGVYDYGSLLSLTTGHGYRIRGFLQSTATSSRVYGPYRSFSVGSEQFFSGNLLDIETINDNNATSSARTSFSQYFNIVSVLANRVPICYAWDIRDAYNNAATSTTVFAGRSYGFGGFSIRHGI